MLRDLEARGAGGSNRSAKSGSAGARPRRGAAIGRLLLLGVLLLAASAYGLREYGFWNGSVLAEMFGVSTTVTGRKPERASMNNGGDATAAPQEKEALTAAADDDPTATVAAPPEEPAKPEKADPAGAGESATPSETATASAERSRAEPGPAADDRTPEETTAPAAAREQGAAEAERRPAAPAREEPEGAVGYALQLGTFSENGNPRAFRAGLPGPVRSDAYLYETADGFTAVRYGFAARVSGLNPAMEFLRAHGLDPVVVESVRKPAASRPEPSAAKKTAPEPANKPAAAAAEPTGEGADGEREGTEAREGPGRMEKRPHRPGPAERAAQHL
ncbi:MAG TPA: hypothetical protein VKA64_02735, partial [Gammaproteobacteria bacterium]|nr:hypothetical protein [Gammaproteobacteria bacterium]